MSKRISPIIFGIALICFTLPWVNFSCQGHKVLTLNGFQLVTGTTIEQPSAFGPKEKKKISGEPLAVFALLSAVLGLILCFAKDKMKSLILLIVSGIGVIMLLLLKIKLDGDILREGEGLIQLNYQVGYYLTFLALLSVAGINAYSYYEITGKKKLPFQGIKSAADYKFCTECGSKNARDNLFCSECGTKFD